MANSFQIKGSDFDSNDTTLKIGQKDMKEIAKEFMHMNSTKYGNMAYVTFGTTFYDSEGSMNTTSSIVGSTLTGVNKTEVVNNNLTLQNKDALSLKNVMSFAAAVGLAQMARNIVSYHISNYGNWKQDPIAQAHIDNYATAWGEIGKSALTIGSAAAVGMNVGGPIGAAIGAVVGAISVGVGYAQSGINRRIEIKRKNVDSQLQYARAGISARNSGGR